MVRAAEGCESKTRNVRQNTIRVLAPDQCDAASDRDRIDEVTSSNCAWRRWLCDAIAFLGVYTSSLPARAALMVHCSWLMDSVVRLIGCRWPL